MKKLVAIFVISSLMSLAACIGQYNKGQSGAVTGGVGGAVVGQAIGRSIEATLMSMAVGTMLGDIVGKEMEQDRKQLNQVYERGVWGSRVAGRIPILEMRIRLRRNPQFKAHPVPVGKQK